MRAMLVCLLLAWFLCAIGCSTTNQPNVQNDASGVWQAALTGGSATSSGFSFVVEFAVTGTNGSLSISNFQFLNTSGCFPSVTGATPSGTLVAAFNSADQITSGTFSFTVPDNGNTLTLTSTGISGTLSGSAITGGTITGTWAMQGSGSGCSNTSGQFTMTQSTATNATS